MNIFVCHTNCYVQHAYLIDLDVVNTFINHYIYCYYGRDFIRLKSKGFDPCNLTPKILIGGSDALEMGYTSCVLMLNSMEVAMIKLWTMG